MKNLLSAVLLLFTLSGCKKIIDQQKENFVMSVMTDGQWIITRFVEGNDTLTNEFNPYFFQFNRDYSVDAIRDGAIETRGTWQGDPENMNITASFPGAGETLVRINGVWHIYQNSLTLVLATQTNAGVEKSLRLEKR